MSTPDGIRRPADRTAFAALSPIEFLVRSATVWRERVAIRHGEHATSYAGLLARVRRLVGALQAEGCGEGDRVAVLLPNVPEMLEAHYGVPAAGAALVPLNTRLSAAEVAWILDHAEPTRVIVHPDLEPVLRDALARCRARPDVVVTGTGGARGPYDEWIDGAEAAELLVPDETAVLSVNYTSGTTGSPKGVMYTHRGAYLHALGVVAESGLGPTSTYLWTLPMFHCNGWAYTWAVTAMGGCHVCLDRFEADAAWDLLRDLAVTHFCGAPTVLTMLVESPRAAPLDAPVRVFVGGAPPAPALLARAEGLGLRITHLYGLTETYGPVAVCAWQPSWDALPQDEQVRLRARQGVGTVVTRPLRVVDEHGRDTPADGETLGEVCMRGNNVMLGYFRDEAATDRAFRDGWFRSGDLGVMHPDGYVELRDRAKDIVISGGENISTIEVEQALTAHPSVVQAAVIGVPDERWGEIPKAFVVLRAGRACTAEDLQEWVRGRLARYKVPRRVEFLDALPVTATGKVQKYVLRERDAAAVRTASGG